MVREEERVSDDIPRFRPGHIFLVDEDSHQLRDSQSRMRL